jgi:mono/diheme cytochrome c family protein
LTSAAIACLAFVRRSNANAGPQAASETQATGKDTAALYGRFCQGCHGASGQGNRDAGVKNVPDFTEADFHDRRSEARLVASILNGKGDAMPAFNGKLTKEQARALTAHVRSFGPKPMATPGALTPSDFQKQLQQLEKELADSRAQLKKLTCQGSAAEKSSAGNAAKTEPADSREAASGSPVTLYRKHCQRCHGADGKGVDAEQDKARAPDFTCRAWQQQHSDAQLITSVLEGKGDMPAFAKTLSKEEADLLVEFIRTFTPQRKRVPLKPRRPDDG